MKAHRTDIVSFAFGLAFVALAVWWLLARILGLTLPPVGWFLAGALVLIGLLGLFGALRSGRHAHQTPAGQPETTVAAPYVDGTPTTGGPAGPEADEWATDAVTDVRVEGREDSPIGGEPHWSPSEPATRELPVTEPAGQTEPATRELPVTDVPEWPAGGRRADGGDTGQPERPAS